MSKSIQDLCWILKQIQNPYVTEDISIEIFSDKSFRLLNRDEETGEATEIFNSDGNAIDINDFLYYSIEDINGLILLFMDKEMKELEPESAQATNINLKIGTYKGVTL